MTTDELAVELDRNKRTLDRWDRLKIGPPRIHLGRTVLYRRDSVKKWLIQQEGPEQQKRQADDVAVKSKRHVSKKLNMDAIRRRKPP
jgi:hypothetical protein